MIISLNARKLEKNLGCFHSNPGGAIVFFTTNMLKNHSSKNKYMSDDLTQLTRDGLPVVSEETIMQVAEEYHGIERNQADSVLDRIIRLEHVKRKIDEENPEVTQFISLLMYTTPNEEIARTLKQGALLIYELLRRQSAADKQRRIDESYRST